MPWIPEADVASYADLRRGWSRREIEAAVASGVLLRVRRDHYLSAQTSPDVVAAVGLGGRLDCVSLMRRLGVFVLEPGELHVRLPPHASRSPLPRDGVVRHWIPSVATRSSAVVEPIEALAQAVRCQSLRAGIATLDSAWHLGVIDEQGLAAVFALLPFRFHPLRALVDPRSESGPETFVRLLLRQLGCPFEVQVRIPGVGRVDFLVDGWLIVECDSAAFHGGWDAQVRDRRRDLAAAAQGYATIRPVAADIFGETEDLRAAIRGMLAAGPHRAGAHYSGKPHRNRLRSRFGG